MVRFGFLVCLLMGCWFFWLRVELCFNWCSVCWFCLGFGFVLVGGGGLWVGGWFVIGWLCLFVGLCL